MSSIKAALKAAKSAIDSSNWQEAIEQTETVLKSDKSNYFAQLFRGRAYEKLGEIDNAVKAYRGAADLKPDDTQAWLGLSLLYEGQGAKYVDEYGDVSVRLAVLFAKAEDLYRGQTTIDKMIAFVKRNGTSAQYIRALQVLLPSSPVWEFLEGRIQAPALTFRRLVEYTEKDELARIDKNINERRTRLGAKISQVTVEVKWEIYQSSSLEAFCRGVIDWTSDDVERHEFEEKLLQRAYDTLQVMPMTFKQDKRAQVQETARGMVIIKHPFRLAWDIYLDWLDIAEIGELDVNILLEYKQFFPESGLGKVLRAFLLCKISPFVLPKANEESEDAGLEEELLPEDILLLMAEGLGEGKASPLALRMTAEYYLYLEEYESAIETVRSGLKAIETEQIMAAIVLQEQTDAFNTILATCLVHYQSPRNHPEALDLLEIILSRKPNCTSALIGLGLVCEEREEYEDAIKLLSRANLQDKQNVQIRAETAWCKFLAGDHSSALDELQKCNEQIEDDSPKAREAKAQTQYRIARCLWEIDSSKAARKSRDGAYSHFLAAIKTCPTFAPAYTSLGFYYADYAKDKKRARQCFQKAFELSGAEVLAAEQLARAFADRSEWDIVELVAKRVIDSGRTRPPPGSKKKGISWPYSALGVVQMTRQEYTQAITSFLSALRISPDDYHSYVGLGESYHNSGRYNSASRTFHYAQELYSGSTLPVSGEKWFTQYMLANVHRELGDYDEAIEGLQIVLMERPNEFGVLIALLQTFVERAWRRLNMGMYGKAGESAAQALDLAETIVAIKPEAFNLWRAVGDACSVFHWCQASQSMFDAAKVESLLRNKSLEEMYDFLGDAEDLTLHAFDKTHPSPDSTDDEPDCPDYLKCAVLAHKRAIYCSTNDVHAQAVAWYNLGWTEFRVYSQLGPIHGKKYTLAAVKCFKQAIELEAGNAEFWNAMGVVTSKLNVKVAQHAFVRSLYLQEQSAQTWTNLGVLYLDNNDHELAHQAFARAQSTDPEYALAWVGEGLIALTIGDQKEALAHFTHAFEISDSSTIITKRQYSTLTFDFIISNKSSDPQDTSQLIQPLFALYQIYAQCPSDVIFRHISALLAERIQDHSSATEKLTALCEWLELEYEETESEDTLFRFFNAESDLARNLLALGEYSTAIEYATHALNLTDDLMNITMSESETLIEKIRLSSQLTLGLAEFYTSSLDASISFFRSALSESNSNPDVICLLSRVLWAHGGDAEREVAKEQILACVEANDEHVDSWILLGCIAFDGTDVELSDIVKGELSSLLSSPKLSEQNRADIQDLLVRLATVGLSDDDDEKFVKSVEQVKKNIALYPQKSQGWSNLSRLSIGQKDGEYAAEMALLTSKQAVASNVSANDAQGLSQSYAMIGKLDDGQRAVMFAPWMADGWNVLGDVIEDMHN